MGLYLRQTAESGEDGPLSVFALDKARQNGMKRNKDQHPNYDYLLVVGPGRSGTDFLYANLRQHPQFAFPEIKEAGYYQSPRRFEKEYGRLLGGEGKILADISNLAYKDRLLGPGVSALKCRGVRVLIVVLLREHCARARSMVRYRRSRGHLSAWLGANRLEQSVVRDRLTPKQLEDIHRLGVDVLSVEFSAIVENPAQVFRHLSLLCGVSVSEHIETRITNRSVRHRNLVLSTLATSGATLLRSLGLRRLLQRLKDSEPLDRLLFVPLPEDEREVILNAESVCLLENAFAECRSTIRSHAEKLARGIYFLGANR